MEFMALVYLATACMGRASRLRDNYCNFADTKINCTNKCDPLGICA
jgi:hypothetical protein